MVLSRVYGNKLMPGTLVALTCWVLLAHSVSYASLPGSHVHDGFSHAA